MSTKLYHWIDHEIELGIEIDYKNYLECEAQDLSPALEKKGYALHGPWFTGDGDSFGPLTRCIDAISPEGDPITIVYG